MTIKVTYNVTDVYVTQDVSPVYINVSYSTGSSGGAAVWGGITGTLSDQTDLQSALDLKVPYTGATANVDLGEYELKAGQVEFDQTPTGTAGVGVMRWNDADGTLDLGLKGGNVTLQLGQEQVVRVVNKTGANLLESQYKVCRVRTSAEGGAQGQRLAVVLAQANTKANHSGVLGIVTENIDNNQEGFITTFGSVRDINTTGSLQGETWADGDALWLSDSVAGGLTNVEPTTHPVQMGYVLYAHSSNGKIFVSLEEGVDELNELHDVLLTTPSSGQVLKYNGSLWVNDSISGALGYTPANAATTLTINGVTYDLSTSRTWTISAGISGSGASGQVAYWTGTSAVAGSADLTWDSANTRLNIGSSLPTNTATANIVTSGLLVGFSVKNTSTGASYTQCGFYMENNANHVSQLYKTGSNYAAYKNILPNDVGFYNGVGAGNIAILNDFSSGNINFSSGASSTAQMTLHSTGNLLLGKTTNSGERLQVQGTTLLNGNVTFSSATGMTWDATNSRLGIGTNAPSSDLTIDKNFNGTTEIRINNYSTGSSAAIGLTLYQNPTTLNRAGVYKFSINTTTYKIFAANDFGHYNAIAGDISFLNDFSTGNIKFAAGGSSTAQITLHNTGNLLLGTTTNSGERLQVTGNVKVTGNVGVNVTPSSTSGNYRNMQVGNSVFMGNPSEAILYLNANATFDSGWKYIINGAAARYEANGSTHLWAFAGTGTAGSTATFSAVMTLTSNGNLGIGNTPTAGVDIKASTTTTSSLRIRSGTAPTTPNDGDIWFDGTDIKMRIGGVTKTFTLV